MHLLTKLDPPQFNFQDNMQYSSKLNGLVHQTISGPVAQRIRHLTTNQGIPGSSPGKVESFSPNWLENEDRLIHRNSFLTPLNTFLKT